MPDFGINSITIDQDQGDSILKKGSLNFDIREGLDFGTLLSACGYNKNIRVTVLVGENGSGKTSICNLLTNKKELEGIDVSSLGDYNIVKKNILSLSKYAGYGSERHYNIFHKAALLNYKHSKGFRFLSEYIQSNFSKKINLNKLYLKGSLNLKFNFGNDDVTRSGFINTLFQRKFHFLKILIDKDRPNLYDFVIYNKDFLPAILDIDKIREILESNYDYMSKVIQSLSLFSIKLLSNITKKNKEKVSLEEDVLSIGVNELNKLKLFFDSKSNQQYEFKSSIEGSSFTSTKAGRRIRKEAPHLFSIKGYIGDISINKISSGENILINDFLQLLNGIEDSDSSDFIIIIDEAALHLHIKRQKKYIKSIVDFISEDYFSGKTFHIILTTHSPYILTDIPINNIVFLKDGRDVSDRYRGKDKQTFANTTYNIVSEFLGANNTMGSLTEEVLSTYVKEMKRLLGELYTLQSSDNNTEELETAIKSEIKRHKDKYKLIIDNIGDPYLKEHLLHIY